VAVEPGTAVVGYSHDTVRDNTMLVAVSDRPAMVAPTRIPADRLLVLEASDQTVILAARMLGRNVRSRDDSRSASR
jgi:hypothetical protein